MSRPTNGPLDKDSDPGTKCPGSMVRVILIPVCARRLKMGKMMGKLYSPS